MHRGPDWSWIEAQEAPQNGQNGHGFQVRTLICHFVPVSRASGGGIGLCYLRLGLSYLRLVFVAYSKLAWSSLLPVDFLEVFFCACGGESACYYLLTVPPVWKLGLVYVLSMVPASPEIGFGLFCLRLPTASQEDEPQVKRPTCKQKGCMRNSWWEPLALTE